MRRSKSQHGAIPNLLTYVHPSKGVVNWYTPVDDFYPSVTSDSAWHGFWVLRTPVAQLLFCSYCTENTETYTLLTANTKCSLVMAQQSDPVQYRSLFRNLCQICRTFFGTVGLPRRFLVAPRPRQRRWRVTKISWQTRPCEGGCLPAGPLVAPILYGGCYGGFNL